MVDAAIEKYPKPETPLEARKAKEIAEAEKPTADIDFNLTKEDFLKSDEPIATKEKYISLKKEHSLLKRILKECL